MERAASRWALRVQSRPLVVIWSCVVAVGICSLGLLRVRIETDPDVIWVPPGSPTSREKAFFDGSFGAFFRINQLIFTAADGANVLTTKYLQRAMHVQRLIERGAADIAASAASSQTSRYGLGTSRFETVRYRASRRANDGSGSAIGSGSGSMGVDNDSRGDKSGSDRANSRFGATGGAGIVNGSPLLRNITLEDLCFRPIAGKGCLVESPGQLWRGDPILLDGDPIPALTAACQTTEPYLSGRAPCMDAIGTPVMRNVVFGGLSDDPEIRSPDPCGSGAAPAAEALVVTFLLENRRDPAFQAAAEAWEKDVFLAIAAAAAKRLAADVQAPMRVSYNAQRSVEDSLALQARNNAWVVVASYAAMFLYVALALGRRGHARSRLGLAASGIGVVAASIAAATGILSALGLGTTLIVWEVVPFLLLAVGVDNVFILVREFDRLETVPRFETASRFESAGALQRLDAAETAETAAAAGENFGGTGEIFGGTGETAAALEARLAAAAGHVAPSVLGAAVCEALAFGVGALTGVPALRQFCIVAAVAVVINLCLQASWFVAALSLDARRVAAGRSELPFCRRLLFGSLRSNRSHYTPSSTKGGAGGRVLSALRLRPWRRRVQSGDEAVRLRREGASLLAGEGGDDSDGSSSFAGGGGGGGSVGSIGSLNGGGGSGRDDASGEEPWRLRRLATAEGNKAAAAGDWAGRFMDRHYLPALFSPVGTAVVCVLAAALLALGITGVILLPMGLEPQLAAPSDSYLQSYYGDLFALGEAGPPAYVVIRGVDYFAALNTSAARIKSSLEREGPGMAAGGYGGHGGFESNGAEPGGNGMGGGGGGGSSGSSSSSSSGGYSLGGHSYGASSSGSFDRGSHGYDASEGRGDGDIRSSSSSDSDGAGRDIDRYKRYSRYGGGSSGGHGGGGNGLRALSAGLAGLPEFVQPPVYSWFDAFASWLSQRDTLSGDCPLPPDVVDAASLAAVARVFVSIPIDSQCCQSFGICGAQFATDVAFAPAAAGDDTAEANGFDGYSDNFSGSFDGFSGQSEFFDGSSGGFDGYSSGFGGSFGGFGAGGNNGSSERIVASRLRFNTQPLRTQRDFVRSAQALRRAVAALATGLPREEGSSGGAAFAYSLYFAFYEQYDYLRGVALQDVALALGAVFLAVFCLAGFVTAAMVVLLVLLTVLDLVGIVWLWGALAGGEFGVSINAVSVVNAVAAVGLSVEFCLHVAVQYRRAPGGPGRSSRAARARAAMRARGASVLTGITLTKLVGVSVLAAAPSQLFRLYYFRMYVSLVLAGAFNGLALLPVLLARWGAAPEKRAAAAVGPRPLGSRKRPGTSRRRRGSGRRVSWNLKAGIAPTPGGPAVAGGEMAEPLLGSGSGSDDDGDDEGSADVEIAEADLLLTHDDAGIEEPGRLNGRSGDNSGVPAPVAALRDFRNVSEEIG